MGDQVRGALARSRMDPGYYNLIFSGQDTIKVFFLKRGFHDVILDHIKETQNFLRIIEGFTLIAWVINEPYLEEKLKIELQSNVAATMSELPKKYAYWYAQQRQPSGAIVEKTGSMLKRILYGDGIRRV